MNKHIFKAEEDRKEIKFGDLKIGECFIFDEEYVQVKIKIGKDQVINLCTCELSHNLINPNIEVIKVVPYNVVEGNVHYKKEV